MKKFVRRPARRFGGWVVVIADGIGPLANELEIVPCPGGREAAYQAYRQIKKELGQGF